MIYIYFRLLLNMAGAAATKVEKKSRTGDGIMLSEKWNNHVNKKKTTKETEKKRGRID